MRTGRVYPPFKLKHMLLHGFELLAQARENAQRVFYVSSFMPPFRQQHAALLHVSALISQQFDMDNRPMFAQDGAPDVERLVTAVSGMESTELGFQRSTEEEEEEEEEDDDDEAGEWRTIILDHATRRAA